MNFTTVLTIHKLSVEIFFVLYLLKTALLLFNQAKILAAIVRFTKIPEMIISSLFLLTGVYMLTQIPEINGFMIAKLITVAATIPLAIIAFKKSKKILALFALFLITMVYLFAEMSKMNTGEMEKTEYDAPKMYSEMCAKCHGADGTLGLMGATNLTTSVLDEKQTTEIILNGRGAMAGFRNALSDEQVETLTRYVVEFKN